MPKGLSTSPPVAVLRLEASRCLQGAAAGGLCSFVVAEWVASGVGNGGCLTSLRRPVGNCPVGAGRRVFEGGACVLVGVVAGGGASDVFVGGDALDVPGGLVCKRSLKGVRLKRTFRCCPGPQTSWTEVVASPDEASGRGLELVIAVCSLRESSGNSPRDASLYLPASLWRSTGMVCGTLRRCDPPRHTCRTSPAEGGRDRTLDRGSPGARIEDSICTRAVVFRARFRLLRPRRLGGRSLGLEVRCCAYLLVVQVEAGLELHRS